jgi:peptidoglycan L-alanyl-D-glutamate endopeptidase CwlK
MSSRKIDDLHPKLQPLVRSFIAQCLLNDIDIIITCTFRSSEEQDELYKIGRSVKGSKVTNSKGGQSKHNFMIDKKPASKAFDVVLMKNGKCVWDVNDSKWIELGEIGTKLGLEWAGNWLNFKEYPHFQLKD